MGKTTAAYFIVSGRLFDEAFGSSWNTGITPADRRVSFTAHSKPM